MSQSINELQDANQNLKQQLQELTQEATQNEVLMRRTQARQLELLTSESLPDLLRRLHSGLREEFKLEAITLIYEDNDDQLAVLLERHHLSLNDYPTTWVLDEVQGFSEKFRNKTTPILGPVGADELEFFFGDDHPETANFKNDKLKSCAILPLMRHAEKIGYLSFGSSDSKRFDKNFGTEFLQMLATTVSFCLENVINRERLVLTGLTDVLTGWPNRRYLQQRLQEELARVQRKLSPISCIIFDIDKFKNINDTYGHIAGDEVLRIMSNKIRKTLRYGDIAARYGGEEFVIALPDVELAEAVQFAERIRVLVADEQIPVDKDLSIPVTISVGVACLTPEWSDKSMTYTMGELIAEADKHLYYAKSNGRNQVAS